MTSRTAPRLGIDLDGVVADFNSGWMRRYNEEFGATLEAHLVRHWDDLHTHTHFSNQQAFWRWATGGASRPSIFRDLDPYPDAVPALEQLVAAGCQVVILSHKPTWAVHDTFAWLAEHRIPTREVHLLRHKWRVACDVYLDDAPHQLRAIDEHRPTAAVCRFVRPWNQPAGDLHDVTSWADFLQLITNLPATRATVGAPS